MTTISVTSCCQTVRKMMAPFFSIPFENIKKPLVFCCFQVLQKEGLCCFSVSVVNLEHIQAIAQFMNLVFIIRTSNISCMLESWRYFNITFTFVIQWYLPDKIMFKDHNKDAEIMCLNCSKLIKRLPEQLNRYRLRVLAHFQQLLMELFSNCIKDFENVFFAFCK